MVRFIAVGIAGKSLSRSLFLPMLYRLPAHKLGMVVDRGYDFPLSMQTELDSYGSDMWLFRDHPDIGTTRAINSYKGELRRFCGDLYVLFAATCEPEAIGFFSFAYLTPRIRIMPKNLTNTKLAQPAVLHFICSPARAASILSEVREVDGWFPTTIYEPIPVCVIHWVAAPMLIKFRNSRIDVSLKNYRP